MRLHWTYATILIAAIATGLPAKAATKLPPPPDPTLHLFRELLDGGIQASIGEYGVSPEFIQHLRAQLHKDATAYALGQYPNPDGRTTAVATLRASASRIHVLYADLPRGGKIVFKTKDWKLVDALHAWMAATVRVNQKRHHDGGPGVYPADDDD